MIRLDFEVVEHGFGAREIGLGLIDACRAVDLIPAALDNTSFRIGQLKRQDKINLSIRIGQNLGA